MDINGLPDEVLIMIFEELVPVIGIVKALRMRAVSKRFDSVILDVIFTRKVVDFQMEDHKLKLKRMSPPLMARLLIAESEINPDRNKIIRMTYNLGQLLQCLPGMEPGNLKNDHLAVCEAMSAYLSFRGDTFAMFEEGFTSPDEHKWGSCLNGTTKAKEDLLLTIAIVTGNLVSVKYLLPEDYMTTKGRANMEHKYFGKPLQLAAAWGRVEIVQYLLDRGADPRSINGTGVTRDLERDDGSEPSVDDDFLDNVTDLAVCESTAINYSHDLHSVTICPFVSHCSFGSALRAATLSGYREVVQLLLQPDYRLSALDAERREVILAAARGDRWELLKLLLDTFGATPKSDPRLHEEILCVASYSGSLQIVQMMLEAGVKPDPTISAKDIGRAVSPLELAAIHNHHKVICLLFTKPFDDLLLGASLRSALEFATRRGHEEAVAALLKKSDRPIENLLIFAVSSSQTRMVEFLIANGANLYVSYKGQIIGMEAVKVADERRNISIARVLEKAGMIPPGYAKSMYLNWVQLENVMAISNGGFFHYGDYGGYCGPRVYVDEYLVSVRTAGWPGKY